MSRFDLKYSCGTLPHEQLITSIRLFGMRELPRVRDLLATEVAGTRGVNPEA